MEPVLDGTDVPLQVGLLLYTSCTLTAVELDLRVNQFSGIRPRPRGTHGIKDLETVPRGTSPTG